jgi:dethiobiotin synthetase
MNGLFITSNNTNSGKTFISCEIIKALNNTFHIEARKPIETDCSKIDNILIPRDGIKLQQACKYTQAIDIVCPYTFEIFASGEIASQNTPLTLLDLQQKCQLEHGDFMLVEGAGGFYSPLIKNTLNSDLARALHLPVIIVIEDTIGCISEALLTIEAVKKNDLDICCVVLNVKCENALDNAKNLQKYTHETIISFANNADFSHHITSAVLDYYGK